MASESGCLFSKPLIINSKSRNYGWGQLIGWTKVSHCESALRQFLCIEILPQFTLLLLSTCYL